MDISAFANVSASRALQTVQAEVGVKVFRLALDAEAASAAALLDSTNLTAGLGQNLNLVA